jgi:hypothetical protein
MTSTTKTPKTTRYNTMRVRIHPKVYSKLMHLCRTFETEVGAWGIAECADDPLSVTDCALTLQTSSNAEIDWDSDDIALFRRYCKDEKKLEHDQYCHITLHTHPGYSADPSDVDWKHLEFTLMNQLVGEYHTLKEAGRDPNPPWLIMCIFSKEGKMTAHIMYYLDQPPIRAMLISKVQIEVSWSTEKERDSWEAEYMVKVQTPKERAKQEKLAEEAAKQKTGPRIPLHDPGKERAAGVAASVGTPIPPGAMVVHTRSGARIYNPDTDDWDEIKRALDEEEALLEKGKRGSGRQKAHKKIVINEDGSSHLEGGDIPLTGPPDPDDDASLFSDDPIDVHEAVEIAETADIVNINDEWDFLDEETWKKRHDELEYCKQVLLSGGAQFGIDSPEALEDCTEDEIKEYAHIVRTALSGAVANDQTAVLEMGD